MVAKKITYTDFDGNERTETFYFNLNQAEMVEFSASLRGMERTINNVIEHQDIPKLEKLYRKLITMSYGEKSADGREFLKEDDNGRPLWKHFVTTNAYSQLYMELLSDPQGEGKKFFDNILSGAQNAPANQAPQQVVDAQVTPVPPTTPGLVK